MVDEEAKINSFSTIYKKAFRQILSPHGYKKWKRFFYKETDNICYIIGPERELDSPEDEILIDPVPYCADLKSNEYISPRGVYINNIYQLWELGVSVPERYTQVVEKQFNAKDYGDEFYHFITICNDMEPHILPYIHKFSDLEYYYNELLNLKFSLHDYYMYGLSLKLHKYKNTLPYIDFRLSQCNERIEYADDRLLKLRNSDLAGTIDFGSKEACERFAKSLLKENPNYIEYIIEIDEEATLRSKNEITRLQIIKEAVQSNDADYLDKLVAETEESSREYIRQMVES